MNYSCQYQKETIPTLNTIYTYPESKNHETKTYFDVKEIKSGYIEYFPKKRQIQDVFTTPNFINNCQVDATLYYNPMGSVMTDYKRTLTKNNLKKPDQLTWIQDSNEQREEIMSLQMRKMNRTMYETKW